MLENLKLQNCLFIQKILLLNFTLKNNYICAIILTFIK